MAAVGVVALKGKFPTRIMVMDGLKTSDRPAALGAFIMQTAFEISHISGEIPAIAVVFGNVESSTLAHFVQEHQVDQDVAGSGQIYIPHANGSECSELYTIMQAVQRGNPKIIE